MQVYCTIKSPRVEIGGEEHFMGQSFRTPLNDELQLLKAKGAVTFIKPVGRNVNVRYLMYTGDKQTVNIPHDGGYAKINNIAVRCTSYPFAEKHAEYILNNCSDWQAIETSPRGCYVGPNAHIDSLEELAQTIGTNLNILVMRDNGAGDILMSIPTVRQISKSLPDAKITYATQPYYFDLLNGLKYIDGVINYRDIDFRKQQWDIVLNWCNAVEDYDNPRNRKHRVTTYAHHSGVKLDNYDIDFPLNKYDIQRVALMNDSLPPDKKNIAYVCKTAGWNRTYPMERIPELADQLNMHDINMVLIDADELPFEADNIINMTGQTDSFRDAALLCAACDMVVTPDTGLAHAAGALGLKTLVICGDIPPDVRFAYYPRHEWITCDGHGVDCYPCWSWQEYYPDGCTLKSCKLTKDNKCMRSITVDEIVEKVVEVLNA